MKLLLTLNIKVDIYVRDLTNVLFIFVIRTQFLVEFLQLQIVFIYDWHLY